MSIKPTELGVSGRKAGAHVASLFTLSLALLLAPATGSAAPGGESGPPAAVEGRLEVIVEDDFENQRFRLLHFIEDEATGRRFQLRFEGEPPGHLKSGAVVRARGQLQGEEIIMAADGDGSVGVEMLAAATATPAFGEQRTLVMVANFVDKSVSCSVDAIRDVMFTDPDDESVDDLYQETSFGDIWFSGGVAGPYSINYSSSSSCDVDAWANAADDAAMADGVNLEAYDRKVYVMPLNACPVSGTGTVGGNPSRGWIFTCHLPDVFAHELGHNLGMGHAGTLSSSYGDTSDIMGIGGGPLRQINAPHKEQMGWLRNARVETLTESGLYEVAPLEANPVSTLAPHAMKIFKADTGEYYYLSYRRAIGFDANLSGSRYLDSLSVHRYPGDGSGSRTYSLATLADNESFVDGVNGITITQLSHSPDGSSFSVSLGGTSIDPCVGVVCQNGGACDAGVCLCATGFTGEFCEINIDDCSPGVCQNGGLCVDGVNTYACECPMGFTGPYCETNVNDCSDNPCQNDGLCVDDVAGYTCDCASGFEGTHCEINSDDCTPNPCQNGGTCFDGVSAYACECIDGHTGTSCEVPPPGGNWAPLVSLTVSTTSGEAPLEVAADAAASDSDGEVVAYAWSFGDGSVEDTAMNVTSHTYTQKGRYNACVTVTDDQGATATDCAKIRVVSKAGIVGSKGKRNNRKSLTLENAPLPDGCDVTWEFFAIDMQDARTAAGAWNVVEEAALTHGSSKSKSGRLPACFSFYETYELCSSLGDGEASCWLVEVDGNGDLKLLEGDAERFMASEGNITEEPGPPEFLAGCSAARTNPSGFGGLLLLAGLFSLRSRRRRR